MTEQAPPKIRIKQELLSLLERRPYKKITMKRLAESLGIPGRFQGLVVKLSESGARGFRFRRCGRIKPFSPSTTPRAHAAFRWRRRVFRTWQITT